MGKEEAVKKERRKGKKAKKVRIKKEKDKKEESVTLKNNFTSCNTLGEIFLKLNKKKLKATFLMSTRYLHFFFT